MIQNLFQGHLTLEFRVSGDKNLPQAAFRMRPEYLVAHAARRGDDVCRSAARRGDDECRSAARRKIRICFRNFE
ncbi:hypothetical protein Pan189_37760 [Stratiformator vulcanicus]|uniref:Uncharacterized protein n=1 Tax=Stratiformator vulcanicus TaxID=2527980 RepID=A0A517R678_9PLAN|nr:hypothetical protein Pan189_37760 [Stratiformator vulcanicus]